MVSFGDVGDLLMPKILPCVSGREVPLSEGCAQGPRLDSQCHRTTLDSIKVIRENIG